MAKRKAGPIPRSPEQNMRIAQIAPLAESVPPKLYGGTERVVSWLTDELVGLGHDVTLFASGDSRTRVHRALRLSRPRSDPAAALSMLLEAVAESADDFDVIHSHLDWVHLPLLRRHLARPARFAGSAVDGAALSRCSIRLDLTKPARTASRPELRSRFD
jgi:hypothetical protein